MHRGTAFLIVSLLLGSPAYGQTTRVETIADQQAEKAKKLEPEGPSDAELIVRRVLLSPLLSGGGGAYPWFGSVFGGSGMAVGAGYLKRFEKSGSLNFLAGISINNSQMLETRVVAPALFRDRLQIGAEARWLHAKGVSYYGVGPGTDPETDFDYDYQPTEFSTDATFTPVPWLSFGGGYSFVNLTTGVEGFDLVARPAPGLGRDLRYNVMRAEVAVDSRTSPGYSTRGGLYRVAWERHEERHDLPFSFDSQEYEMQHLVPLVREQFVIAVRGLMTLTSTDAGNVVPVPLAPFLGSGSTLRAFPTRRFTDRNRVLLTGEYRWRPSRYLDMAIFVDSGQVAPDRHQFRLSDFETNYGIGARFHGPLFTALRIEYARGREGQSIIFAGSQIF
ncbi:MAG: hypothetical protein Q8O42_08565 [Acidobacteriota bacterium]|nr:hypothetical protein [Acidobacteriota bacterium]